MRLMQLRIFAGTLLLASCMLDIEPDVREVSRHPSPDSQLDAVLLELNFGATTPFVYRFYVVPEGHKPDYKTQAEFLLTDQVNRTTVEWLGARELLLRCLPGTVYSWVNVTGAGPDRVRIEVDSQCPSS